MNIKGLAHIAIYTTDMEGTIAFYEKLGAQVWARDTVQKPTGQNHLAMMRLPGFDLELIEPHDGTVMPTADGPIPHIAIEVEDLAGAIAELKAKGIDTFRAEEPKVLPHLFGGLQNIFFTGPNGEALELLEFLNK